jgi:multiple sugar transport system substrate-binding protein
VPDVTGLGGWQKVRRATTGRRARRRGALGLAFALVVGATLTACGGGGGSGVPTLNWYINPDGGGQATLAEKCTEAADGRYRIETTPLPNDASGQREQLVRRLAADDSSIDLMSLDPVFMPEFAAAEFLRPFTDDEATELTDDVLDGPLEGAQWDDQLYVAPFYANTQLLWYRKSVAEAAGIDPARDDITWDQMIDAAEETDSTVAITGSRYEGYTVVINSLVASAGGEILQHADRGRDAEPVLESRAGREAAEVLRRLGRSSAAAPGMSNAIENDARIAFEADNGGFMVNWPFVYQAAKTAVEDGTLDQSVVDDIAWARVPGVNDGEPGAPPLGGINIGISAFTKHPDLAVDAVTCLTTTDSQTEYMLAEGNPGSRSAVFDDPEIREQFPMASLIRDSIDDATPRPLTPFYTDVSGAIQRTWHPPSRVNPDSTPKAADDLIVGVLQNEQLL